MSDIFDQFITNIDDIRFDENGIMRPDVTQVAAFSGYIDKNVDSAVLLTKGWYRFTIGNPVSFEKSMNVIDGVMPVDDGTGEYVDKRYSVGNLRYDVIQDEMYVDVHVVDNPIPLILVWGAVAVALAVAGALAANSVLRSVEKITTPVFDFFKSPVGIILMVGVLALMILPYFKRKL